MKKYDTVLFDLDGTLTDPREGITKSVQYALKKMGIIEPDLNKLTKFIGPPLVESFQIFYSMEYERAWQAVEFYREYFAQKGIFENRIYPGIGNLLQGLKENGCCLAVATSKPTVFSEQILDHFNLSRYFNLVVGSNLDGSRVAKTEIIAAVLDMIGIENRQKVVMVGDRKHDILGAKNNDIASIAVAYGYGDYDEFSEAGATYIVQTVAELYELLID